MTWLVNLTNLSLAMESACDTEMLTTAEAIHSRLLLAIAERLESIDSEVSTIRLNFERS